MGIPFKSYFSFSFLLLSGLYWCGCSTAPGGSVPTSFYQDSLLVEHLLRKGDSIYARRSGLATIAESLLYFDSAHRMAQRLGDTLLFANTLFFIGNVYNAWNKEPQTTIEFYQRSAALFNRLPQKRVKAFYVRYILAHAYDGEKANDSLRCVQTLQSALADLQDLPDSIRAEMLFLSDFAWVATNVKAYPLAEAFFSTVAPRHRIKNDPTTNNYLDHYYLTRAHIDVWGKGLKRTPYLDSLRSAMATCGNRYDSAYYSRNLSELYESTGNTGEALHFCRLSENLSNQVGQSDILSVLRQELLERKLQAEGEKQQRIAAQLRNRNTVIVSGGVVFLLLVLLYGVYRKRRRERVRIRRQEEFTRLLLQKEEEERRRLATDLHDGVNHELLSLKNNLLLQKQISVSDVESVITTVREVSRNLYPALFESVGLGASVQSLSDRFTAAGFFTTCDIQYSPVLSKEAELQVYRIIQEALNNVAKHANADAAKITISTANNIFTFEIKDNGNGFDVEKAEAPGGSFGLQSIRQRALVIGASLSIYSNAGGTVIRLTKTISS